MYYTTSGAYRRTKMFIDYANIVLTVIVALVFIAILIMRSSSGILFPVEFLLGAVVNGLTMVKLFMNHKKTAGIISAVVMLVLLVMAVITWLVVTR